MFKKGIAFITAVALVTSGIVFTPSNAEQQLIQIRVQIHGN